MQQTGNAQRTANAPQYATARLPIPLTPYVAAYQQQLLESTSLSSPLQQLRTRNILNIIINATGTFHHTLRLIIHTTDKLQARPSTTTVHLRRAYYLQDLQHLIQPTQLWEGQVTIFCLKPIHVIYVALQSVPETMYHNLLFKRNIKRGLQIIFLSTRTYFLKFINEFYQEVGFVDVRNPTRYY